MQLRKYLPRPPAPPGFFWRLAARFAIASIAAYQKHLSPRKGFHCAHRALHGGASCSEFVRRAIARHGLREARWLARARFGECRLAARRMRALRMHLAASAASAVSRDGDEGSRRDGSEWCTVCDLAQCGLSGLDCTALDCSGLECLACGCS